MGDHLSVRAIKRTGIPLNHVTVWRWRHRFLAAAASENTHVLSGVVEADETFFIRSFKGHRGWKKGNPPEQRAARPSGWGALRRGISRDQVAVLTALDTGGGIREAVLPSLSAIEGELRSRIAPGSVLVSDGQKAYVRAAVEAGAEHRTVVPTGDRAAGGEGQPGAYEAAPEGAAWAGSSERPPRTAQDADQQAVPWRGDEVSRQLPCVAPRDGVWKSRKTAAGFLARLEHHPIKRNRLIG